MKTLSSDPPAGTPGSPAPGTRTTPVPPTSDTDHRRRQAALSAFGRRVSCQPPLRVLLEDAVSLAADALRADCGYYGFVVGSQIEARISRAPGQHAASPASPPRLTWPLSGDSAAASVLRSAQILAIDNLAADRRVSDPPLREMGLAAALTVPLYLNARPYAVLGLCCARPRPWNDEDILFVETIAHMLSAVAARLKSEDRLREEQAARSTLLGMVHAVVLTLDAEGRIIDMNPTFQRVTQFTLEELRGRHFWELLVMPQDAELVASIFRGSSTETIPSEFATLLRAKDGTTRRVSWSLKLLRSGGLQSVLLAGEDRTDREQTVEQLQKITKLARKAINVYLGTTGQGRVWLPGGETSGGLGAGARPARGATACPPVNSAERRASPRHHYPYVQMIAPYTDQRVPGPDAYFPVECKDISATGVAFFLDSAPDFQRLIMALGPPRRVTRVVCRVVRVAAAEVDGRRKYLVGCGFIGRMP